MKHLPRFPQFPTNQRLLQQRRNPDDVPPTDNRFHVNVGDRKAVTCNGTELGQNSPASTIFPYSRTHRFEQKPHRVPKPHCLSRRLTFRGHPVRLHRQANHNAKSPSSALPLQIVSVLACPAKDGHPSASAVRAKSAQQSGRGSGFRVSTGPHTSPMPPPIRLSDSSNAATANTCGSQIKRMCFLVIVRASIAATVTHQRTCWRLSLEFEFLGLTIVVRQGRAHCVQILERRTLGRTRQGASHFMPATRRSVVCGIKLKCYRTSGRLQEIARAYRS